MAASIVTMGARTVVGLHPATAAAAVRAGISRLGDHPQMVDRKGEPIVAAYDRALPPSMPREERLAALAVHAAQQVLLPNGQPVAPKLQIRVLLALPELDESFDEASVRDVSSAVMRAIGGIQPIVVQPVPGGHSAGARALSQAIATLQLEPTVPVAVVGADSYIDADVIDDLERDERLQVPLGRYGFSPGEGAGAVLLATNRVAAALGSELGQVASAEFDHEPQSMRDPDAVCTGEGLARAWKKALRAVPYPSQRIAHTYADSNGERYRDRELTYTMLRVPHTAFVSVEDFSTAASSWGDVGAATVLLHTVLAVDAAQHGRAPGEYVLLSSSSPSGLRGAVVLRLPAQKGTP